MKRARSLGALVAGLLWASAATAITVDLNSLTFTPPTPPTNEITINVNTDAIGNDSDTATVSGMMTGKLDFDLVGTSVEPTGLELTGGNVALGDTSFSFLFGAITATSSGISGVPDTLAPPSVVSGGMFAGSDHSVLLNQGTLTAAGEVIDLALNPISVVGTGTGQISVTSNGPPVGNDYSFQVLVSLPIEFSEMYTLTDVPIVNTVNVDLVGQGVIEATQEFSLTILAGDYNFDGLLDCVDLGLLEQEVDGGGNDLAFDANGDNVVNGDDELFWLSDLRGAGAADANLDDVNDGQDFILWNANKFQAGTGWCTGDFNHDGTTDGQDFIIWNANKFTSQDGVFAVPEPRFGWYFVSLLLPWAGRRRR